MLLALTDEATFNLHSPHWIRDEMKPIVSTEYKVDIFFVWDIYNSQSSFWVFLGSAMKTVLRTWLHEVENEWGLHKKNFFLSSCLSVKWIWRIVPSFGKDVTCRRFQCTAASATTWVTEEHPAPRTINIEGLLYTDSKKMFEPYPGLHWKRRSTWRFETLHVYIILLLKLITLCMRVYNYQLHVSLWHDKIPSESSLAFL